MIAWVERPDKGYDEVEMGEPVCGEDFCDSCGDCLDCYWDDECYSGVVMGDHMWVIYLEDERNPNFKG